MRGNACQCLSIYRELKVYRYDVTRCKPVFLIDHPVLILKVEGFPQANAHECVKQESRGFILIEFLVCRSLAQGGTDHRVRSALSEVCDLVFEYGLANGCSGDMGVLPDLYRKINKGYGNGDTADESAKTS